MPIRTLLPRLALLAFSLLLACAPAGDGLFGRLAEALRLRFPGQAARILSAPHRFAASPEGFAGAPRGRLGASLPRRGEGAIRFEVGPDFTVSVREVGAAGQATLEERSVAYPRAGGTSFWAAEDEGYEEWLLLEASAVRRDAPVAAWELEGATARQRGEAVDVVDERGTAQIAVTAPEAYAAGGRAVGARLEARGARVELWVDAEGEAVLVDPAWKRTRPICQDPTSMCERRFGHTATMLGDGKVLITGGFDASSTPSGTAVLYDPATRKWTSVNAMTTPRANHTATLLDDTHVLVTGGITGSSQKTTTTAEVYNAETGQWTPVASMSIGRADHTATRLDGTHVLVAGGFDEIASDFTEKSVASAEVYDATTGTWKTIASMNAARADHTATALADGTILVAGGHNEMGKSVASVEAYNAKIDTWTAVTPMKTARRDHTAMLLDADSVLVTGGFDDAGNYLSSVEVYDALAGTLGTWTNRRAMSARRIDHTATALADGTILVAGGRDESSLGMATAEVYHPTYDYWMPVASMNTARESHTATLLKNGHVLVAGGRDQAFSAVASAEEYELGDTTWKRAALMNTPRAWHTATLFGTGSILVTGGYAGGLLATAGAERYDPETDTWTTVASMSTPRSSHTATLLDSGLILVAGGTDDHSNPLSTAELYDPKDNTWTKTKESMNTAHAGHTATLLQGGKVLVAGGYNEGSGPGVDTAEVYDPIQDAWTTTKKSMNSGRHSHTATRLDNSSVLVVGGFDEDGASTGRTEVYDPEEDSWTPGPQLTTARRDHTATALDGAHVLIAGGRDGSSDLAAAEVVDLNAHTSTRAPPMSTARVFHTATRLLDGSVLVAAGDKVEGTTAEMYDPKRGTWTSISSMHDPHHGGPHTATLLRSGKVFIAGSFVSSEIFQPLPQGSVCSASGECKSRFCVDGICCDEPCDKDCGVCSVAIGADTDGTCKMLSDCKGFACDKRGPVPMCLKKCATSDDCDPGHVCKPPDAGPPICVEPRSTFLNDACAVSTTSPASQAERPSLEPALILLTALAAIRRRATGRGKLTRRA